MRASRRNWNVNLQKVKVVVDGKPQTIRISARALKTLKNKKAISLMVLQKGRSPVYFRMICFFVIPSMIASI